MALRLGTLLAIAIVALVALSSSAQAEAVSCALYASPTGSDSASGSAAAPLRTVQELVDRLSSGQTGCLRDGSYSGEEVGQGFVQLKISQPGVKLTSAPGEAAEIDGRVWIARGADGVTLEGLTLDGANSRNLPSPTVDADRTVFRDLNVSNDHTAICFILGEFGSGEVAVGTVIETSRIHDCGDPATNQEHGIYVNSARESAIRDNWIYDNGNRGIQLYPDAQQTTISENVIYGNGEGIIFSGNESVASSENTVVHNVIADSTIRGNVESFYEAGAPVGTGNEVRENCLLGAASSYYAGPDGSGLLKPEVGFHAVDNVVALPRFADPAGGDFEVLGESPCGAAGGSVAAARSRGALVLHAAQAAGRSVVTLSGTVPAEPHGGAVTFEVRRGGAWRRLARRRLGEHRFRARVRLPRHLGGGRLRFRARAAGVRPSAPVVVRVRLRGHFAAAALSRSVAL